MISIGVDCEEIERFHKILEDRRHLERILTPNEIEYCLSKADPKKHLAARFCAKEAMIKALSYHKVNAALENIEILNDANGVPRVRVNLDAANDLVLQVSLSHCNTIAFAQAIVYDK
ncbi:MAG: holo-ACP synthase [Candidatus Thermoplasmatota archaeon]|jgi:phosphopantetheine--protein transferase-like protein|nr:holo-ACP synthase [Candidatus Thermoplasmatota archaeon]MDP7264912.1 holo-ACP synthase [Candidatus Thermoplasmatota archaeon]